MKLRHLRTPDFPSSQREHRAYSLLTLRDPCPLSNSIRCPLDVRFPGEVAGFSHRAGRDRSRLPCSWSAGSGLRLAQE